MRPKPQVVRPISQAMAKAIAWEVHWGKVVIGYRVVTRKGKSRFLLCRLRLRELMALMFERHGGAAFEDPARYLQFAAGHITDIAHNPLAYTRHWSAVWTPEVPDHVVVQIVDALQEKPRRWSADQAAWFLGVTPEERAALGLTTIGAMGQTSASRLKVRKEKRRKADEARRRSAGAKPRALASAPWAELGYSRAQWYRLGKPTEPRQRETDETRKRPPLSRSEMTGGFEVSRNGFAADRDGASSARSQRKPEGRGDGLRPFSIDEEHGPIGAAPTLGGEGPPAPMKETTTMTNTEKVIRMRDYQPEGTRKILQMIQWMREDEAAFRRRVAEREAELARAA